MQLVHIDLPLPRFEWDESKRELNLLKHEIDFVDAVTVFHEPVGLVDAGSAADEERFLEVACASSLPGGHHAVSAERIVIFDPRKHKSRTDWARVDALTDADIARAVADDPDAAPLLTEAQLRRALWVIPVGKTAISIRLDEDILHWFKAQGPPYQTRINAVLRAYMVGEKAARRRPKKAPMKKKRAR